MPERGFSYGDMRSIVVFERDDSPKSTTTGASRPWTVPTEVLSCRARVRPAQYGAREVVIDNRVVTLKTYDVTIHWTDVVTDQMRIRLQDGRYLLIRQVPIVESGQRFLDIRAEQVQ